MTNMGGKKNKKKTKPLASQSEDPLQINSAMLSQITSDF